MLYRHVLIGACIGYCVRTAGLPPPIQPLNERTYDGSISMLPMEDGTYSLDTFVLGSERLPVCSVRRALLSSYRRRVLIGARVTRLLNISSLFSFLLL